MTTKNEPAREPWTPPVHYRIDRSIGDATKVAGGIFLPGPEGATYHGTASFNYSVVYTYQS